MKLVKTQTDVQKVTYELAEHQHDDELLAVGLPARTLLTNTEDAIDDCVKATFFRDVRSFYCAVVRKMMKIFPFDDTVLADMIVLDPAKRVDLTYAPIVRLAARFTPLIDQEVLKEEFEDYQLMDDTEVGLEESGVQKSVDRFWGKVMTMKTAMGETRFPTLTQVMVAVLSLPHSNADCERAFSVVRKIHTECRQSLGADTLTALLQCKMNQDCACYEFNVTTDMVTLAKHATHAYNMQDQ